MLSIQKLTVIELLNNNCMVDSLKYDYMYKLV